MGSVAERNGKTFTPGEDVRPAEGEKTSHGVCCGHQNFPLVQDWLYPHKNSLIGNKSTQMMVRMMNLSKQAPIAGQAEHIDL